MRKIPFYPLLVLLVFGMGGYLGCDPGSIAPQLQSEGAAEVANHTTPSVPVDGNGVPARTANSILVASFNMQRLGPSKLQDSFVMDRFAAIIRAFDVVALQEITSVDQRTLPTLVELVNSNGSQYSYCISPRIGREGTGYYEQYAYVFDSTRIEGGPDYSYVVRDDQDVLHREPFVGRFRTRLPSGAFEFSLINMHTDPDEISYELDVLANVYRNVRTFEYPEDDVILLGDLNAAPQGFQQLGQIPGVVSLINDVATNARGNKTLDNILIDRQMTTEFTGRAGVLNLERYFHITYDDAKRISDHLPVWAEFSASETRPSAGAVAAGAAPVAR